MPDLQIHDQAPAANATGNSVASATGNPGSTDPSAPRRPIVIDVAARDASQKEQEDRPWRRKAVRRRLKRRTAVPPPGAEASEDYVPQFLNPRVRDNTPVFEQSPEELAGHPVMVPDEDAQRREAAFIWFGCAVVAGLAAWALVFMFHHEMPGPQLPLESAAGQTLTREEANFQSRAATVPEACAVVRNFLRAVTPEEKAVWIRGGRSLLPAMQDYYVRHPDEPAGFEASGNVGFGRHDGRQFFLLRGKGSADRDLEALVEVTPEGLKLDWRFLTGAGDMDWLKWIESRPTAPLTMRVEARLDDYYAGAFADSREWLCLQVTDAARSATVWAYVPRLSDDGLTILRQLHGRSGTVRLQGRFEFNSSGGDGAARVPQARLCSADSQGWLDRSPEVCAAPLPLNNFLNLHE
jgi:hypothetical protein